MKVSFLSQEQSARARVSRDFMQTYLSLWFAHMKCKRGWILTPFES